MSVRKLFLLSPQVAIQDAELLWWKSPSCPGSLLCPWLSAWLQSDSLPPFLPVLKWHSTWWAHLKKKVWKAKAMAPFRCQSCGKSFLTLEKFTIHNYSHSRERPFKCSQAECGKAFVSKYKLMRWEAFPRCALLLGPLSVSSGLQGSHLKGKRK